MNISNLGVNRVNYGQLENSLDKNMFHLQVLLHVNQTHHSFHMRGFARGLFLKHTCAQCMTRMLGAISSNI